jgi:glucose/mannose-6-phosphate isomerase
MIDLDLLDEIKSVDKSNLINSIRTYPRQIAQAWTEVKNLDIPQACILSKNVVVSGMGGSALGGRIIDSLICDRVRTPIEVFTEFHLPNYVNHDTLVILSSYSGNTEETLSAAQDALARGATIFAITTGGKLAEFMRENNLNGYVYKPSANPSGQPRMGLGYSITATLAVLARCEFINLTSDEVATVISDCEKFVKDYDVPQKSNVNLAKSVAKKLFGKIPVLIASEHLVGSAHAFKNQLNENAKTFAVLFDLPEANHHLMEGLVNPPAAKDILHFLFLKSALYSQEVLSRYDLTVEVVEKNRVAASSYEPASEHKLNQIFELLVFASYVSYYQAMLYRVDPTPIPWVDYFKEKIATADF